MPSSTNLILVHIYFLNRCGNESCGYIPLVHIDLLDVRGDSSGGKTSLHLVDALNWIVEETLDGIDMGNQRAWKVQLEIMRLATETDVAREWVLHR